VDTDSEEGSSPSKFALLTVPLDLASRDRALRIQNDTLQDVLGFAGLSKSAIHSFLHNMLPVSYYNFHYKDDDEVPDSLTIVWRCPRLSEQVIGVARIQFKTRNCFAWITCLEPDELSDIVGQAMANLDLLRVHPLYLLSFMFDLRFVKWTDWFAVTWRSLVQLETATGMTHPRWALRDETTQALTNADALLQRVHATRLEMCHSHGIMAFGDRLGRTVLRALEEVERHRLALGRAALTRRQRDGLEERLLATLARCEAMRERLGELDERLSGQINVVSLCLCLWSCGLTVSFDRPSTSSPSATARSTLPLPSCKRATAAPLRASPC
jgi:hypothetical protein